MDQEFESPVVRPIDPAGDPVSNPVSPVGNPLMVWSVFFILFGMYLLVPAFQSVFMVQISGTWPIIDGKVISSEVEKRWPDRGDTFDQGYLARIWYTYRVDGADYMGHSLRFQEDYTKNLKVVEATVKRYPVGRGIDVRYDPKDPSLTIVERNIVPVFDCFKLGLGIMFVLCGALASLGPLMRENKGQ